MTAPRTSASKGAVTRDKTRHVNAISYGGGVQTVALAILAAHGRVRRPDLIVFADTGGESEATYSYNERMRAWLAPFGLTLTTARAHRSLDATLAAGKAVIPFYGSDGGQLNRVCTERWKIRIVRHALREAGATTATVMLGISLDEAHRMKDSDVAWASNDHPLIDAGLRRSDCERIITAEGLPVPPKSACVYCPHRTAASWVRMRRDDPVAFQHAVSVEAGFSDLYLHSSRIPLPMLVEDAASQGEMFDEDGCTGGYCFV
jgi:3'-phosphoadenosine 5'-phosphosulfate sulfotransferase (PAPS reductase)/FAD synthetase